MPCMPRGRLSPPRSATPDRSPTRAATACPRCRRARASRTCPAASRARRRSPTSTGSPPPTPPPRVRAIEAGFDAVEVHLGHSYLASAFLSPKINHRKDEYGGTLANRAKVARGILRAVRDAVGDRIAILTKLNMSDGVRGGITVEEAIQTAQWIEADGTVDAFEMTAGSSLLNPMFLFRAARRSRSSSR